MPALLTAAGGSRLGRPRARPRWSLQCGPCSQAQRGLQSWPLASLLVDQGLGVAGVPVQQQPERHPGRRDGPGQDHPDHRSHHVPHGAQADQRTLSHHSTSLVSALAPGPGVSSGEALPVARVHLISSLKTPISKYSPILWGLAVTRLNPWHPASGLRRRDRRRAGEGVPPNRPCWGSSHNMALRSPSRAPPPPPVTSTFHTRCLGSQTSSHEQSGALAI